MEHINITTGGLRPPPPSPCTFSSKIPQQITRHRDIDHGGPRQDLVSERALVKPVAVAGGPERECAALSAHADEAAVQEEGCAFVANVAFEGREGRQQLVRLGASAGLTAHQGRHTVLQEACAALANLSQDEQAGHAEGLQQGRGKAGAMLG